jgi:plastocyanin
MMGGGWLVLILVLVAIAVALTVGQTTDGQDQGRAREILRQRLAAGEIDVEEYRERAELLGGDRTDDPWLRRWLPAALAVVAVLLLLGLLFGGMGRSGGGWWGHMDGRMGGHMDGLWGQRTSQGVAPDAVDGADGVALEATEMAFDPASVEITAGEPVNLTVTNTGRAFHDLTIDELGLQIDVDRGQTATAGLEVDEPGEYVYYCSVPGHASAGMQGTLTVLAP